MFLATPSRLLTCTPHNYKFFIKLALGVVLLLFFLDYQPSLTAVPIKQNVARAHSEQTQTISAGSLPFAWQLPHPGYLSTPYSSWHPGIDIASGLGMPVKPIAPGVVNQVGVNFWGLGLTVKIDHSQGFSSLYAHLGKVYVKKDQVVSAQDWLGEVGLTGFTSGPHTHLEITRDDQKIDPLTILPQVKNFPTAADFTVLPTGGASQLNLKIELKKSL